MSAGAKTRPIGDVPKIRPLWEAGPAARLLTRACGMWRVPHGLGVPGHFAYVPYRVLAAASVQGGYDAEPSAKG